METEIVALKCTTYFINPDHNFSKILKPGTVQIIANTLKI